MKIKLVNKKTKEEFECSPALNIKAFFLGSFLAMKEKVWPLQQKLAYLEGIWIIGMIETFIVSCMSGAVAFYSGSGIYIILLMELFLLFVLRIYEAYDYNYLKIRCLNEIGYEPSTETDRNRLEQLIKNDSFF